MPKIRTMMTAGVLFSSGLFLTAMACASMLGAVPSQIPTPLPPTAPPQQAQPAVPLYKQVAMSSSQREEHGQLFGYQVTAQVPVLVGSQDPRVQAFNAEMANIVNNAIAEFEKQLADLPPTPVSAASTFDLRYNVLSPPGNILSLKFDIQTYYTGAAHPGDASRTVTFDLERGQDLSLADLFVPSADFLTPISKYCTAQLDTRDIGFQGFELGATATAANYRNWNVTADGLMITFDEYQVAPYAAGPQTVVMPYSQLAKIIQPDGPLAAYLH